jgi:hypothetical protein
LAPWVRMPRPDRGDRASAATPESRNTINSKRDRFMKVFLLASVTLGFVQAAQARPPVPPVVNIVNTNSNLCVDSRAADFASDSSGLVQNTCSDSTSQQFLVQGPAEGPYKFVQVSSGNCIEDPNDTGGLQLLIGPCSNAAQFIVSAAAGNAVALNMPSDKNCLDVFQAETTPGGIIDRSTCTGNSDQRFLLTLASSPPSQLPPPIAGQPYKLSFDDEFTSLSITSSSSYNGATWYNGVKQCCLVDSVGRQSTMYPTSLNGMTVNPYSLGIDGTPIGLGITLSLVNKAWYSGVLSSTDRYGKGFSQQYGYFEMKANLPDGPGEWPAFWLASLPTSAMPAEIDIMEEHGITPASYGVTLHDWANGGRTLAETSVTVANQTVGFHVYGMLWTASTMSFYFDNHLVWQTPTPPQMQQPYFIFVDMGLGAGFPTQNTPSNNTLQVQYIRVYRSR